MSLTVNDIVEDNLLDLFMGTLKEIIQHHVCLLEPKSLEHAFFLERKDESKNMATRKLVTNYYKENHASFLKPERLTAQ